MTKKNIAFIILIISILIAGLSFSSCSTQTATQATDEDTAIEKVKENYTTMITGEFKAVEYENGYIVNNDDVAYWYVEGDNVWNLNQFAKIYTKDLEYKFDIENYKDLF